MSEPNDRDLDPELRELLAAERSVPALASDHVAKIHAAARAKIDAPHGGEGGGEGGEGPDGGEGENAGERPGTPGTSAASNTGRESSPASNLDSQRSGALRWLERAAWAGGGVLVGVALATTLGRSNEPIARAHRDAEIRAANASDVNPRGHERSGTREALLESPERGTSTGANTGVLAAPSNERHVAPGVRDGSGPALVADAAAHAGTAPSASARGGARTADSGPARVDNDGELAAERVLVEAASSALARRRAADALQAAVEHAQRFSNGRLSEERESLRIRALATLGRHDEAWARAEVFRARFPDSMFRALVEHAVATAPDR